MALPILRRGGNGIPSTRDVVTPVGRIDPWNELDYMDRMFDSFFRAPFSALERSRASARTDGQIEIYETAEELIAVAFVPGLSREAINVSATNNSLVVQGERKPLFENKEGLTAHTPWSAAVAGGSYNVECALPVEINPNNVRATYTDGVFEIHLPKAEAVKAKQIKIDVKAA